MRRRLVRRCKGEARSKRTCERERYRSEPHNVKNSVSVPGTVCGMRGARLTWVGLPRIRRRFVCPSNVLRPGKVEHEHNNSLSSKNRASGGGARDNRTHIRRRPAEKIHTTCITGRRVTREASRNIGGGGKIRTRQCP